MKTLKSEIVNVLAKVDDEYRLDYQNSIKKICSFYAKLFELDPIDILNGLEKNRKMSIGGYYTEGRFPTKKNNLIVFENEKDLRTKADPGQGFRCPHCHGVSKHPYICDSDIELVLLNSEGKKKPCNWKAFGLFGTLGEGMTFTIKDIWPHKPFVDESFMPIAMENKNGR